MTTAVLSSLAENGHAGFSREMEEINKFLKRRFRAIESNPNHDEVAGSAIGLPLALAANSIIGLFVYMHDREPLGSETKAILIYLLIIINDAA